VGVPRGTPTTDLGAWHAMQEVDPKDETGQKSAYGTSLSKTRISLNETRECLEPQKSHTEIEFATENTDPRWAPINYFQPCFRGSWSATRARKFNIVTGDRNAHNPKVGGSNPPPQPMGLLAKTAR
jgi:hypothetical protein